MKKYNKHNTHQSHNKPKKNTAKLQKNKQTPISHKNPESTPN